MIFQNDDLMNEYPMNEYPMNEYPMNEYPMNEYPMNDEYFYDDFHNHYLYNIQKQHDQKHIQRQNQYQNQNQTKKNHPHVKNETDEDWGFYVEIDPPTPPKILYSKPKNNQSHLAIKIPTHVPQYNETTQQKNVNYLPQIQEEQHDDQFILDMDLPPDHSNNKTYNDDYKENITQNIFSGLTICALTTASIYFYSKIRSS